MKKVLIFIVCSTLFFGFACLPTGRAAGTVDINTASLAQLDNLTGIGPVLAQRIIDSRPYSSVDGLLSVKGIGPVTLQKIKDQGLACVNCETTQTTVQTPAPTTTPTPNTPEVVVHPSGIFINEILPNPEGADETDEWIVPTIQQTALAYS